MHNRGLIFLGSLFLAAAPAIGHVPIFSDGTATSPQTAIAIGDPTVSRVIYHEVTDAAPQVWATFQGNAGQQIPFRLGVPMIDRLAEFRPALAILGPGLPPVDVPFTPPDGLGGVLLLAPPDTSLEPFHEEFTGTDSWIVGDLDLTLPQDGQYFVVAYVPSNETGKLWVAMGDREVFAPEDIANFGEIVNRVRAFHEIAPSPFPCFVPLLGALALTATFVRFHRRPKRMTCVSRAKRF